MMTLHDEASVAPWRQRAGALAALAFAACIAVGAPGPAAIIVALALAITWPLLGTLLLVAVLPLTFLLRFELAHRMVNPAAFLAASLAFVGIWPPRRLRALDRRATAALGLLAFAYLLATLVSLVAHDDLDIGRASRELFRLLTAMCAYLSVARAIDTFRAERALGWTFALSATAAALYGLLQIAFFAAHISVLPQWEHVASYQQYFGGTPVLRAAGPLGEPGELAAYLTVALGVSGWLYARTKSSLALFLLSVQALTFVATFSTSGWYGAVAAGAVLLWKRRPALLVAAAVGVVVVTTSALTISPAARDIALQVVFKPFDPNSGSLSEHAAHVRRAGDLFLENALFGIGPGLYPLHLRGDMKAQFPWLGDHTTIQNAYAEAVAEGGLLLVAGLAAVAFAVVRRLSEARGPGHSALVASAVTLLLVLTAASNWKFEFYGVALAFFLRAPLLCPETV